MSEKPPTNRAIAYIDGFNLYHGLKDKDWKQFYWIDPAALAKQLLTGGRVLSGTKYFTARVKSPEDKRDRQSAFLDAICAQSDAEIILGRFFRHAKPCRSCGVPWVRYEEKMTDSAIAAHLVADAFLDSYDTAILVGGDTDIIPAIKLVRRHFPEKRLEAWFPPRRKNQQVSDACHDGGHINGAHLGPSVMPDEVVAEGGVILKRPESWGCRPPPATGG